MSETGNGVELREEQAVELEETGGVEVSLNKIIIIHILSPSFEKMAQQVLDYAKINRMSFVTSKSSHLKLCLC